MKFEIKNRWTGSVQFTAEIECDEGTSLKIKIGLAVKWAFKAGVSLSGADLSDAVLSGAVLRGADLSDAVLSDADLSGAVLRGADLSDAVLRGADLRGAVLSDADLSDADLSGAVLRGAVLRDAVLRGAVLRDADLSDAVLSGAVLSDIRADFLAEVLKLPNELEFLRDALTAGKVDGSTYAGECACLAGTLAHARGIRNYNGGPIKNGCTFIAESSSPRERFFTAIRKGDTPEKNAACKIALDWTNEAIAIRDNIRAHVEPVKGGQA